MLKLLGAAIVIVMLVSPAEARRHQAPETPAFDRHAVSGSYNYGPVLALPRTERMRAKRKSRTAHKRTAHRHPYKGHSASLSDVTPILAAKAREIIGACDAKVISAYRPGARVRGYGTASLHARYPAEAIDMTGDTSCIYPRLKGWAGGYSVDYAAVRHIHISMAHDRRERGSRFAHYGTRRYASRRR